jgi:hypothetical protein
MAKIETFKAWAIELGHGLGLAGGYYFEKPTKSHAGNRIALFETRQAAKEHHDLMYYKKQCHIRRVTVTIEVES